jgi:hypothetical protein
MSLWQVIRCAFQRLIRAWKRVGPAVFLQCAPEVLLPCCDPVMLIAFTHDYFHGASGVPRNFVQEGGGRGSTNLVKDRGQRERGSGGGSPLVRSSAQFANE